MNVLEQAVEEAQDFPVRKDVHKALDYFYGRCDRKSGINLFLAGLRDCRTDYLLEGLKLLKKHSGFEK